MSQDMAVYEKAWLSLKQKHSEYPVCLLWLLAECTLPC